MVIGIKSNWNGENKGKKSATVQLKRATKKNGFKGAGSKTEGKRGGGGGGPGGLPYPSNRGVKKKTEPKQNGEEDTQTPGGYQQKTLKIQTKTKKTIPLTRSALEGGRGGRAPWRKTWIFSTSRGPPKQKNV